MSQLAVSVVNLTESGENSLASAQKSIEGQISGGHDVVLVSELDYLRSEHRLFLAEPALASPRSRLAFVCPCASASVPCIPPSESHRIRFFSSMENAMRWLRPQPVPSMSTLRYITVPK